MYSPHSPAVALTFDDGPDPDWTLLVLDVLASVRARATFFVVAPRASRHPSLLARMRKDGHEVGFHCTEHVRHDAMRQEEIEVDVRSGLPALAGPVRLWRTPWGVVTAATEVVARRHGLTLVGWTADTEDWRGSNPQEMLLKIEGKLVPQAVVLMHDGIGPGAMREDCRMTVDLIAQLVYGARDRGLEPVSLREMAQPFPDRNPDPAISRIGAKNGPLV